MKNENLPVISFCPFCGYTGAKLTCKRAGTYQRKGDAYQVLCGRCYARGPLFTYKYKEPDFCYKSDPAEVESIKCRAIEAWNETYDVDRRNFASTFDIYA